MYCPFCTHQETRVLESRLTGDSVRRRRECGYCSSRFTTYEKALFDFAVIKKDGREELYAPEKILNSIRKACSKTSEEDLKTLAKKVEQKILQKKINQIPTRLIGKLVLQELKGFDKFAYLRFATVHKSINDAKLLKKELQKVA